MDFHFQIRGLGRDIRHCAAPECGRCLKRPQCTWKKSGGWRIARLNKERALDDRERRSRFSPQTLRHRKAIVEHPFGTMKRKTNQNYFWMRGLDRVKAEMRLTVTAYNLKQALNILGVKRMVRARARTIFFFHPSM
jgi:hypothetical protein